MLEKITITGEYLDNSPTGIIIGGKVFRKGFMATADVTEDVYFNLKTAHENKWFNLMSDNYNDFLVSRGRAAIEEVKVKEEPVVVVVTEQVIVTDKEPVTVVEETPTEIKKAPKSRKKAANTEKEGE